MAQAITQHTLGNGLTLILERMEHVRSVALNILVPAGYAHDPPGASGMAACLSELIGRGAGDRDSRALADAFDGLGVDHDESPSAYNMRFGAATLARNIGPTLDLYADLLRRPHLPDAELAPVQALALQDIQAIDDSPQQKVFLELRKSYYPAPLNNDRRGTPAGVEGLTPAGVRAHYRRHFTPAGAIVSVAGNVEWGPLLERVERLFGDWRGEPVPAPTGGPAAALYRHVEKPTQQTQIALACPSVPFGHPDYYAARGAVMVLSGGMSARLFTEVREKRGLCYSVSASHESFKDRGSVLGYAGTRSALAQQTLEVTLHELRRLAGSVEDEEVERVRAGLKSSLIMQEESTGARAAALASDWFMIGRVRTPEEIQAAIDGITPATIIEHLRRRPYENFAVVTLGPEPLTVPE